MTNEHERIVNEDDDIFNPDFLPTEKQEKRYVKKLRYVIDKVFTATDSKSSYIPQVTFSQEKFDGVECEVTSPAVFDKDHIMLHIHGGGYVLGSPQAYRSYAARLAVETGLQVVVPDYALAPERPFPAGLDDVTAVYKDLLARGFSSDKIIVSGDSAGGGMVLAFTMYLRDHGIDLPRGVISYSPYGDLTFSGKTAKNVEKDMIVADFPMYWFARAYVNRSEITSELLQNPLISPVFGDFTNFPPMLVMASQDEILYDDAVRIVDKALYCNVEVEFISRHDLPHVWPCVATNEDWPEIDEDFAKIISFITDKFNINNKPTIESLLIV